MRVFCLDTNTLIKSWHERYPIDVFPTFWERLAAWGGEERVIAPDEILFELERVDDELLKWAKTHKYLFVAPEADVQAKVKEILQAFPRLVDTRRNRSRADPFVIALAEARSAIVVTEELRSNGRSPKIPDVCDGRAVPCIRVIDLIREMGLKF